MTGIDLSDCICAIPGKPPEEHFKECPVRLRHEAQPPRTFRVRQKVIYYLETTIEAESAARLQTHFIDVDIDEVLEDVEPEEGPWQTGDVEVDETDKKPQWKLEGDQLVKVKV